MHTRLSAYQSTRATKAWPLLATLGQFLPYTGLSGSLNEFILSDFPKVETRISVGLLVTVLGSFVWHNFFSLTRGL